MTPSGPNICCVRGCEAVAAHSRTFTIKADFYGEIEAEAHFCCRHIDGLEAFHSTVWPIIVAEERPA